MGLRNKRDSVNGLTLKIHRPDLHFSSLNIHATPHNSFRLPVSVSIDTIQVAVFAATEPPGSFYICICCTVNLRWVVIVIFGRKSTVIMISQVIASSS